MRKTYLHNLLVLVCALVFSWQPDANAQCLNTTAYLSNPAPTSGSLQFTTCIYSTEYTEFTAVAAATNYRCAATDGGTHRYITITDGTPAGTVVAHGPSPLTWASNGAGTYYMHVTADAACAGGSVCHVGSIEYLGTGSCIVPSALAASNITTTTADITFTAGNATQLGWEVSVVPTGNAAVGGTASATTTFNATGLSGATDYDAYVREICAAGDTSSWTGPITFTTACPAFTAPYLDDIEAHTPTTALTISNCWTASTTSAFDWNIDGAGSTPSTGTGPTGAYSGVNYFYVEASSGAVGDLAELTSPLVDINPLTSPILEFRYHMFGDQQGVMSDLYVDIYDGSTWTVVDSIKGEQHATQAAPWSKRTVYLSTFSGTIQVKFRAYKNGAQYGDISLDDIELKEAPTCPDPSNLVATNITATSADFGWTENGSATDWQIEWGATGFTQGTGTNIFTTSNPENVTGLTPNTSVSFYVRAVCGAGDSSVWAGPMTFVTPPTCPQPTNLMTMNLMPTSVDLAWTEAGSATSWEVEYGAAGFAQGTGTAVVTGSNPENVTGLTDNTDYEFYVRAICGPADSSVWTGPFAFSTPCLPVVAPWLDDVEAHTPTLTFSTSQCWSAAGTAFDWNIDGAGSTPSVGTGPTGAYSGVNYFYVEASSGANGDLAELTSPFVDITPLTAPVLDFYYHMYGDNNGVMSDLFIDIYDGSTWIVVDSIKGEQQAAQADPWLKRTIDLSTFSGTIQVKFRAYKNGAQWGDVSLDDIEIKEAPSCFDPSTLTATNVTATSADLGWTENGTATSWEVEWGAAGFTPGTGTNVVTSTNPENVTGLTAATTYEFYVRAICGPADSSGWAGPFSFTTPCAVYVPAYYTDFTTFMPTCWDEADNGTPATGPTGFGTGSWNATDYLNGGGANNAAKINLFTTGKNDWLVGPTFDLSVGSWELVINAGVTTYNGTGAILMGSDDTVQVLMSTNGGTSWTPIYTWDAANTPSNTGGNYRISLMGSTNPNTMFAIWATEGTVNDPEDFDFHVNDFEIRAILPPAELTITEIMYNGPEGGVDSTEFIEIYNNTGAAVDVSNWTLTGGTYTFPAATSIAAGAYYVVAVNPTAFNTVYGMAADGQFTNGLSNGGESIFLYDMFGQVSDSVIYDDNNPWPTGAAAGGPDGGGASLILCDVNTDNNDGANWAACATSVGVTINGFPVLASPGAANNCPLPPVDVEPTEFIGLDTTYCNVAAITASVVITNNSPGVVTDVPYTIWANGFPILTDSIATMAPGQMDTIVVGPIPAATGVANVQVITGLTGDIDMTNDTLSQMVWISNTTAMASQTAMIMCNGDSTAEVTAMGSNGLGTYNYMWDNGAMTAVVAGLPAGTYMVTVTDSIGCSDSSTIVVMEPAALALAIDSSSNPACNGGMGMASATATGGSGTINYLWMGAGQGTQMVSLPAGTHYVTATDSLGCTAMDSVVITEPTALVAAAVDNANATATASGTGGTAPYMFMWDAATGNQTTATVTGLINGTYAVTVTDSLGCMDSTTVTITGVGFATVANVSNLNMFPNPTSGNVFVELELNEASDVQITILNAVGQLVARRELVNTQSEKVELKTAALPAGVYMVQFTIGHEQMTRKLIISK